MPAAELNVVCNLATYRSYRRQAVGFCRLATVVTMGIEFVYCPAPTTRSVGPHWTAATMNEFDYWAAVPMSLSDFPSRRRDLGLELVEVLLDP